MPTFNLRKETLLFWSSLCALPTQKSLLARNFTIVHHFLDFLESFNTTFVYIPKQTHCWAPCNGVTGRVFLCPLCLLSLVPLSFVQKCIPVVCPFPHCAPTVWWRAHHKWLSVCHWWTFRLFPAWGLLQQYCCWQYLGACEREFLSGIG